MSNDALLQEFFNDLKRLGYADSTLKGYRQDLHTLALFCGGPITAMSQATVEAFISRPNDKGDSPSPAYRNRRLSCLRSFFRFLVRQGWLDDNHDPTRHVRFSRLVQSEPSFLSYAEYVKIIRTVRKVPKNWLRRRDLAIIATLYNTGIRLSELTALNVEQFDKEGERFVGLKRKGGKIKDLPVNQNVVWALGSWLNMHPLWASSPRCPMFVNRQHNRLSGRAIEKRIALYAQKSGMDKPVTPHTFRHSHCTEIQRRGAEARTAQAAMGHRRIETTMRYSHSEEEDIRLAIGRLNDPELWEKDELE